MENDLIEKLIREMQLRNYSPRSILTYSLLPGKIEDGLKIPMETISVQHLKDYLHQRNINEKISVSTHISWGKGSTSGLSKRLWYMFPLKPPRFICTLQTYNLPVFLGYKDYKCGAKQKSITLWRQMSLSVVSCSISLLAVFTK